MKNIKKIQYAFIILVLLLVVIPIHIHADNKAVKYDIVGWYDENCLDAVTSVKVNGVKLSEYNTSMYDSVPEVKTVTASASGKLKVEIKLKDGYALGSTEGGSVLFLSGVQSETEHLTESASAVSIQLPSSQAPVNDKELYLAFKAERQPKSGESEMTAIDHVQLDVKRIDCGAEVSDKDDFSANVSVPSGSGYRVVPDSVCLVRGERAGYNTMIYVENVPSFKAISGNNALIRLDIEDRGSYAFSEEMLASEDIEELGQHLTINNGELVDCDVYTWGGPDKGSEVHEICLTVRVDPNHSIEDPVEEDRVEPTCTAPGHHYKTGVCSVCGEYGDSKVELPALGHKYGTSGDSRFTCTVCGYVDKALKKACREADLAGFIAGVGCSSTSSKVTVKWGKVPNAGRYVIYAAYCNKNHTKKFKKIKTVSGKVTKYSIKKLEKKKIDPKKNVKVYIVAQKKKSGKWSKIFKTPEFHIAGKKTKYSNVKKITIKKAKFTLNKGKTSKIKPKLVLINSKKKAVNHVAKFRYKSTNTAIAKVTKSGKIKAVGKGKATVFVYSNNGTAKAIKVTVR